MAQTISPATAPAEAPPVSAPPAGRLRPLPWFGLRAIGIAVLLTPLCCYWAAEAITDVILSLLVPPVVLLLVLILLNGAARAVFRRTLLTTTELVIIYGMLQTATAIAAEWMWVIHPLIGSFAAFGDRNSKFGTLIIPNVPDQLHIKDKALIAPYVTGGATWGQFLEALPVWAGPVFWWTVVVFLVCFAMLCINVLMRQEWTDREKLSFPIIQLPLAMAQGGPGFWRSRFMWGGFVGVAAIDLLNGFAFLYPALPSIPVRFLGDLRQAFPDPPFNAIGWTPVGLFPFIVGLGIFLPVDLMFSVIFFFFLRKASQVVAASMGYPQGTFGGGGLIPSPPYFSEQTWGAFLGLFVSALWVARRYLKEVWRDILTGAKCPDGGVPRRWAFGGLIASYLALGGLGFWWNLGFGFTLLYLGLFLAFSIALTRMRAQLGPPTHEMAFMGPNQLLVDFYGTQGVPASLIARTVTLFHFTNRIHRTHPMPTQLELMKMGERTGTSQGVIFAAVLIAVIAASVFGHLTRIWLGYQYGARMGGADVANVVSEFTTNPRLPNTVAMLFVGVGFVVVLLLNFIRFQLPWFPLHPMGYALAMNFGVDYYWFGLMVAWALKSGVLRYSGLRGYDKLHQAALGVILGEFAVEGIWATVAMVTRMATYTVSINGRLGWNQ
jgi:uncharacterized protein DUF6785/uncharacterized protein DUF6784